MSLTPSDASGGSGTAPRAHWTHVATEGEARARSFAAAARRIGAPAPRLIDYRQAARHPELSRDAAHWLRFDSPERHPEVLAMLLARGEQHAEQEGSPTVAASHAAEAFADRGRIVPPRQLHLGVMSVLSALADAAPRARLSHPLDEIDLACSKSRCQDALAHAGVPVPHRLGDVSGYEHLRALMDASNTRRVFLKLRHGASASGLVALEIARGKVHAFTTCERERGWLYNTRQVRELRDEREVRPLIEMLCGFGCYAERWFPKTTFGGGACDLRVVLVGAHITHVVLRQARRGPFTNLHLGGRRHLASELRAQLCEDTWSALLDGARAVRRVFPKSVSLGVDIALGADRKHHAVLEVNVWGDLVKGALDARGRDPSELILEQPCA